MEAKLRDEWVPLYRFDLSQHVAHDYEVANWYVCTHPKSFLGFILLAARPDVDRRYALRNADFPVHQVGGETVRRRIESPAELRRVLEEKFLITLPDGENVDRVLADIVERT
jgi:N-hydroxyarylamine O-acetyltransferase